jgi:uncharacterized protein YjiS (DUF1127 family)
MHTATIRSAQPLGTLRDGTPSRWRTRLRSILSSRWYRKNEEPKHDSLHRLGDRALADIGLYRGHRIHRPHNRTDQQQVSPVPVALLAMWMPRI